MSPRPTAVVDFAAPVGTAPSRLVFRHPAEVLRASSAGEVRRVIEAADIAARDGAWVVGFVSYEAAPAFDPALATLPPAALPLAWFAVFPAGPDSEWPTVTPPAGPAPAFAPRTAVTDARYAADVARIREYIAAGDVYQVNHTVPFEAAWDGDPLTLYEQLRAAQGGAYSAYIDGGDFSILSASPELFFERTGDVVRMRPMKGTAGRGLSVAADDAAREVLVGSEKDRAENVMIVDLVRNDLGRLARTGTVRVTSLFEAERYPRVWQLTSTVEAEVDAARPLTDLFAALFPCGSVTGAPKVRAMQIIRELEGEPREVYCGAVGVIRPGGDATFNVAIRTAWTTPKAGPNDARNGSAPGGPPRQQFRSDDGARIADPLHGESPSRVVHLAAGGAVTVDSTAASELREVHAKLAAFTIATPAPALFETLRVERGTIRRLERHLERIAGSARYFGIPFDASEAAALLHSAAANAGSLPAARARLVLQPDGALRAGVVAFADEGGDAVQPIALAARPVDADDVRLYHKTTDRALYESAMAAAPDAFDVLLWNAAGEVTEFTRGNVVARYGDRLITPPVACGLLPGTLRGELLASGEILEAVLPVHSLPEAEALWFVNALRGWIPVALRDHSGGGASRPA